MVTNPILALMLAVAASGGQTAVKRAMTPRREWVAALTKKTGANLNLAIEERDESADAWAEFVVALTPAAGLLFVATRADQHDVDGAKIEHGEDDATVRTGLILESAVMLYRLFGRGVVKGWLTPPRAMIEAVVKVTGADFDAAVRERDEAVEELLEFIESLVNPKFADPD